MFSKVASIRIRSISLVLTAGLLSFAAVAGVLPDGARYDPAVPTPESVLGFGPGERHVRHDRLVRYLELVAEASPRVQLRETGRTHEDRPLLLLTVSAPERLAEIERIRQEHLLLSDPMSEISVRPDMPAVIWMGYSVHGNEASGSNAVPWLVYHLAAVQGPDWEKRLRDLVVLVDPSLNPDGLGRFTTWVNAHLGANPVADPQTREHREAWPGGRTNHYWFDLNRDWLPLVQPESQVRVENFHRWKPNVLTDFHEMGTNSSFFFQPGVPSRQHPLTPAKNLELTRKIAGYHAAALDEVGQSYFTEELFDDFYYGKGSTYPDVNGGVGILFEQASVRGHVQSTSNGLLTFERAVRNQFLTSISTLEAAAELREELLRYQRSFYRTAIDAERTRQSGGYLFGDENLGRVEALASLLRKHRIELMPLSESVEVQGIRFTAGKAYAVPLVQAQARLARALLETRTEFEDSTFYDVSSWNMAMAYDVPFKELSRKEFARIEMSKLPIGVPTFAAPSRSKVGYVIGWDSDPAPIALQRLLDAGIQVRFATEPFVGACSVGDRSFGRGALVVPVGDQTLAADALLQEVRDRAADEGLEVCSLKSGLSPEGPDLGSSKMRRVKSPKPLLIVGKGVSGYEAGELWHLMDRKLGIPVTQLESARLRGVGLDDYTHLILVEGRYDWDEPTTKRLLAWVRGGGVVLASRSAARWVHKVELDNLGLEESGDSDEAENPKLLPAKPEVEPRPFAEIDAARAEQTLGGAIFEVRLDRSHPLGYGLPRDSLSVFRSGTMAIPPSEDPHATFARYTAEPLLSGFTSAENLARLAGTAAGRARRVGQGVVVVLTDNPAFRGFWKGSERIWINGLYFSGAVRNGPAVPSD